MFLNTMVWIPENPMPVSVPDNGSAVALLGFVILLSFGLRYLYSRCSH